MPGENIYDWSITAVNNGTADTSINWAEGQPRASVNNSARSMMAAHAKDRNLQNGSIITGGSANAQTVTSGMTFTTVPTGMRILVKIGFTNTAAATLDLDSIGAVAIKDQRGNDLIAGRLLVGAFEEFLYDGTNWRTLTANDLIPAAAGPQVITASGVFTPATGLVYAIVECVGGGGQGGGATGTFGLTVWSGSGGAGGYSRKTLTAAQITGQTITIGAGGAGGGFGNGGAGGTTSVGTLCIANGGAGGGASSSVQPGTGGAGGAPGTGDIKAAGGPGTGGLYVPSSPLIILTSVPGGSSVLGGGGMGPGWGGSPGFAVGATGRNYGGGGSGAYVADSSAAIVGANGAPGVVIVTEFVR